MCNLGKEASLAAARIDPRLHPDSGERKDPQEPTSPGNFSGRPGTWPDYLAEGRVPPETNRHGIPHATGWDLGHAMHLVRDLALQLNEARQEVPRSTQLKVLQQLLNLAVEIALVSGHKGNSALLDQLVAGRPASPTDGSAQREEER